VCAFHTAQSTALHTSTISKPNTGSLFYLPTVPCCYPTLTRWQSDEWAMLIWQSKQQELATGCCQIKQWPYIYITSAQYGTNKYTSMAQTNVITHNIKTANSFVQGVVIHMQCSSNKQSCLSALLGPQQLVFLQKIQNSELFFVQFKYQHLHSETSCTKMGIWNPQVHSVK
jgi:hypothetical protein